jgi:hypothetical protein
MKRIEGLYAFICYDAKEDSEGLPAIEGPFADGQNVLMPLVAADRERMEAILPLARNLVARTKKPMKLVLFSNMEVLEEIKPDEPKEATSTQP